jgi:hypothetical protein
VEESFALQTRVILRADPVLTALVSIVKQFERFISKRSHGSITQQKQQQSETLDNADEMKRLKISFDTIKEIEGLRGGVEIARSTLGLVKQKEDWVFNLNISNVMQMSLLNLEELGPNSTTLKLEAINEVARDSMLEKIVLISVAYFCIATEMRFLAK